MESLPGADCSPVQNAQAHIQFIALSQANSLGTVYTTRSARGGFSPSLGSDQALELHTCSAYGIGDLIAYPLVVWPLLPQDSISVEKPAFNLGFLGSCQPAGHGTFLYSPPCIRKASFCSTSRKRNQRKLLNPIATDCPGRSQMVIINDASASLLPCFTD